MIKESVSFWCQSCELDQDLLAVKEVRSGGEQYFVAKCGVCNARVVRLITEREQDEYYMRSEKLRRQRLAMSRDLIQPGQSGFQTYYREAWLKLQAAEENYNKRLRAEIASRQKLFDKHKHDINARETVKAVLTAEERLV